MHGTDFFIFAIFMTVILVVPALVLRYRQEMNRHRERITAMEKGVPVPLAPVESRPWSPRVYLLRGLLWAFGGIGLATFLVALALTIHVMPQTLEVRLWTANRLRSMGARDEEIQQYLKAPPEESNRMPIGVAAIGLIPLGIGVAYLIFYAGERKQIAEIGAAGFPSHDQRSS